MSTPQPGTVLPADVAGLRAAWGRNRQDLGVGLYNPQTGEVRLVNFDATGGHGHQGLADLLSITDNTAWRGFIVSSDGRLIPASHFNLVDGDLAMQPDLVDAVRQALEQAGLVNTTVP